MLANPRIKIILASIIIAGAMLFAWEMYNNSNNGMFVKDVVSVAFSGEVQGIDQHNGLRVRLKDETAYYVLTDYCNGNTCLKDQITFKDSLKKIAGSDVVILQKKYTGETSEWKLKK